MKNNELLQLAVSAGNKAYAPYSGFKVGAALLCKDGDVFCGCNVENASFGVTCCAERTALLKAVSEGKREFSKIAVVGGKGNDLSAPCPPCGICRQALSEFCGDDFEIITVKDRESISVYRLSQLLPVSFKSNNIEG